MRHYGQLVGAYIGRELGAQLQAIPELVDESLHRQYTGASWKSSQVRVWVRT